ncbi:MAG: peptidyl-prolyl cis-trans isomerase [Planctomycetes bacterium]|nr:peptidyl-prolyl cis-trans isomerase [Planctomycetota bacterium]
MLLSTLLLSLAAPAVAPAPPQVQDPGEPGKLEVHLRLRAIVNDQVLTDEDLYWMAQRRFNLAPGQRPTEEQVDSVFPLAVSDMLLREGWRLSGRDETMLNRIIQKELDARIEAAGSLAALSAEMAAGGGTIEDFKRFYRRMVVGYLFRSIETGQQPEKGKAVKVVMFVPPREIRDYFDNNQGFYSTARRAKGRILMVPKADGQDPSRARIEEIRLEITSGTKTFVEGVQAYSDFKKSLDGASGWYSANMTGKAQVLKDFFLGNPAGTLSEPLDLGRDWALCLVETVEEGGVTPFEEVQEEIRKILLDQRYQETLKQALARTRKRCYVWPAEEVDQALALLFADPSGEEEEDL